MGRFANVDQGMDFVAQEHRLLEFWARERVFDRLHEQRAGAPPWSFLDGPITANNPMGVHHAWGRAYKDAQQRYRAMRGFDQRYQNGFDCQGLWVEVNVEKAEGIKTKRDIEAYGIDRFVIACKQRVLEFAATQTEQSIRLGQWMRWDDPATLRALKDQLGVDPTAEMTIQGAAGPVTGTAEELVGQLGSPAIGGSYFTFSDENNYCIWAFLKRCHERGLIYRGRDVIPWCWRCGTAISDHEMETEGYKERTHQAVFVRFPLIAEGGPSAPRECLLVWTTTPWTLTSNVAVAVGPDLEYARVRQGSDTYYVATEALGRAIKGEHEVVGTLRGEELVGRAYAGPYDELEAVRAAGAPAAHRIIPWREVSAAEGTGMVHIAPGCGAEDFALGREFDLPAVAPLDDGGHYVAGFGPYTGQHVEAVASPIVRDLGERGFLYRAESYTHRYPTCWRCGHDLVFRLVDEWFISMGPVYDRPYAEVTPAEKAASLRYQIMDVIQEIRWIPEFGYEREMDWLRNMQDWMISKKRYWGLALPIWECDDCGHFDVVGSRQELRERAVAGWGQFEGHTPHRPHVDAVELACPRCGGRMRRVLDVGNPWLDAGIVAYSTLQYRHDRPYWEKWFPADFITESFPGQFRNWFYSLLTMSTVLENRAPMRSVLGFATLLAEDGSPMHKSAGNMIDFDVGADRIGVDVMRWMYLSQRPEANLLFGYHTADEARRQFLLPLWNCYAFFANYAGPDGWTPAQRATHRSMLDRWLEGRRQLLVRDVTAALDNYDHVAATRALQQFVERLSTWYVRRSRRRVWKSETDADKLAAYTTLYDTLVTLATLLAPLLPFVAEAMYENLVRNVDAAAPISVHLGDWPAADVGQVDARVDAEMGLAIEVANAGRAARAVGNVKLRQPVARIRVFVAPSPGQPDRNGRQGAALPDELVEVVKDELNVKAVEFVGDVSELATYRVLPNNQLLGPKFGKQFPMVRKALLELDPAAVARQALAGSPVEVALAGERVTLRPEELLVQTDPRPGLAVASDGRVTVGVDTDLTPGLVREGVAREFVRHANNLRKDAGFALSDRIHLRYRATGEVAEAIEEHRATIMTETLAVSLAPGELDDAAAARASFRVPGQEVQVAIQRA